MRKYAMILVTALIAAPLGAQGADLVMWWDEGWYAEEAEAAAEVVDAFEQETGKQVELVLYPEQEHASAIVAALERGRPPDFAFGIGLAAYVAEWALDDRLVDLTDTVGFFSNLFDPDALDRETLLNAKTGQKALYALPVGRSTNHIHVWKSLVAQAGFKLDDIPDEWDAFWSFWCDVVQPALRRATGREDVWGVGLPMSVEADDTWVQFYQFLAATDANYVTGDGRLIIDDPKIRQRLIQAVDSYATIYRDGCAPPEAVRWTNVDNNRQFHAGAIVMTVNETLSIPSALRGDRPDDYFKNTATIEWPLGPGGEPFPIWGDVFPAMVFKDGANVATAEEFVRFLVSEGWLAHYLNFSGERMLPSMSALLDQPFWLDPTDPHRMASVMQVASRPLAHDYAQASGDWRHYLVLQENVWGKAIHRVAVDSISPEQAVDERSPGSKRS
ncbi:MAG TPA: ABC transporter substrate-binding protein [Geminicoccaceae bacterium]|nr:ABC transporter substrate-binding protein [Geminicoccaceae bacterium]